MCTSFWGRFWGPKRGPFSGPGSGTTWSFVAMPGHMRARDGKPCHIEVGRYDSPVAGACWGVLAALRRLCLGLHREGACAAVHVRVPGRAPEPALRPVLPGRRLGPRACALPQLVCVLPRVHGDPVSAARRAPVHGSLIPGSPGCCTRRTFVWVGGWPGVICPGYPQAGSRSLASVRTCVAPVGPVWQAPQCRCYGELWTPLPACGLSELSVSLGDFPGAQALPAPDTDPGFPWPGGRASKTDFSRPLGAL